MDSQIYQSHYCKSSLMHFCSKHSLPFWWNFISRELGPSRGLTCLRCSVQGSGAKSLLALCFAHSWSSRNVDLRGGDLSEFVFLGSRCWDSGRWLKGDWEVTTVTDQGTKQGQAGDTITRMEQIWAQPPPEGSLLVRPVPHGADVAEAPALSLCSAMGSGPRRASPGLKRWGESGSDGSWRLSANWPGSQLGREAWPEGHASWMRVVQNYFLEALCFMVTDICLDVIFFWTSKI